MYFLVYLVVDTFLFGGRTSCPLMMKYCSSIRLIFGGWQSGKQQFFMIFIVQRLVECKIGFLRQVKLRFRFGWFMQAPHGSRFVPTAHLGDHYMRLWLTKLILSVFERLFIHFQCFLPIFLQVFVVLHWIYHIIYRSYFKSLNFCMFLFTPCAFLFIVNG